MVSDIAISTKLDIPREVLWKVRSASGFTDFLVANGALNRMDVSETEHIPDSTIKKCIQTYVPKTIEIPAMVKPIFDDTYLEIKDKQQWDSSVPYEVAFSISPGVLQDYVKMSGVLKLEVCEKPGIDEEPDSMSCVQTIEGTCQVDIPFVGWYVEQAIVANMQTFYETYNAHIQAFVQMLTSKYGNGSKESIYAAADKMTTNDLILPEERDESPNKQKKEF